MALTIGVSVNFLFQGASVGDGVVHSKGKKAILHTNPLPKGCVGVQVKSVWEKEPIALPHPIPMDEDTDTLQKAVGTVVAWPLKQLVKKNVAVTEVSNKETTLGTYKESLSKQASASQGVIEPSQTLKEGSSAVDTKGAASSEGKMKHKVYTKRSSSTKQTKGVGSSPAAVSFKESTLSSKPENEKVTPIRRKNLCDIPSWNSVVASAIQGAPTSTEVLKEKSIAVTLEGAGTSEGKATSSGKLKQKLPAKSSKQKKGSRGAGSSKDVGGESVHMIVEASEEEEAAIAAKDAAEKAARTQAAAKCAFNAHLQKVEIRCDTELPRVPLCRLIANPVIRPLSSRVEALTRTFDLDGYIAMKSSFLCSLETADQDEQKVTPRLFKSWDKIWQDQHNEFERQIKGTAWEFVSNRLLYTWDGNHRLEAWTRAIQERYSDDAARHPLVVVNLVKASDKDNAQVIIMVARLNKYNEVAFVPSTFVDNVCLVRALGEADTEALLETLKFVIPSFAAAEMQLRANTVKPWYKLPLSVLSQIASPEEYNDKMHSVWERKKTMSPDEWQELFQKKFFEVSKDKMKFMKHATAIADPGLGEQWWKFFTEIKWDSRPKTVTEEKLYNLACADITNNRKFMVLSAMCNQSDTAAKILKLPTTFETQAFRAWLHRDALWYGMAMQANGILLGIRQIYKELPTELKFHEWLECMRDEYHSDMFFEESTVRKGTTKSKARLEIVEKPLRRMIYRWLYSQKSPLIKKDIFTTWVGVNIKSSMYSDSQLKMDYSKEVLLACPFFVDFQRDTYPPFERAIYEKSIADRRALTEPPQTTQPSEIAPTSPGATSKRKSKPTAAEKPNKKRKAKKASSDATDEASKQENQGNTEDHDTDDNTSGYIRSKQEVEALSKHLVNELDEHQDLLSAMMDKHAAEGHPVQSMLPDLQVSQIRGGYFYSIWQSGASDDSHKLAIAETLHPLCRTIGKSFTFQGREGGLFADLAIVHIANDSPVFGIGEHTVPEWNKDGVLYAAQSIKKVIHFLGSEGVLLLVCSPVEHSALTSICAIEEWHEYAILNVICRERHSLVQGVPTFSMFVVAFRHQARQSPRPKVFAKDVIFDVCERESWLKKDDGTPWRGGMQRGRKFWETIIGSFTKPNDIILQLNPDGPLLAAVGVVTGRHVIHVDADAAWILKLNASIQDLQKGIQDTLPLGPRIAVQVENTE